MTTTPLSDHGHLPEPAHTTHFEWAKKKETTDMTDTMPLIPGLVRFDQSMLVQKDHIDMYGVYVEAERLRVTFKEEHADGTTTETVRPVEYARFFVAGNMLCSYRRHPTATRTVWRYRKYATPRAASEAMRTFLEAPGWVMRGAPILVALTTADKMNVEQGKAPAARYVAQLRHESTYGKYDDDHMGKAEPKPIPPAIVKWAAQWADESAPTPSEPA